MNLQYIKAFMSVVEHKSISGAAQSMFVSQSTVSFQINQLEKTLGTQLLLRERGRRNIELTAAGKSFIAIAQQWLDLDRQTDNFIHNNRKSVLRIAASAIGYEYLISHIIYRLLNLFPSCGLQFNITEWENVPSALYHQNSDVAFAFGRVPDDPKLIQSLILREERCILCPIETPLHKGVINAYELDPAFEVKIENKASSYTYLPNTTRRSLSPSLQWVKDNFPEGTPPMASVNNLVLALPYFNSPKCWSIFPKSVALSLVNAEPNKYTYRNASPVLPFRDCFLVTTSDYPNTPQIQALLRCVDDYINETPYLHKPSEKYSK